MRILTLCLLFLLSAPIIAQDTQPYGWARTQSEHLVRVMGAWAVRNDPHADAGARSESASANAVLRFAFEGEGIRVVYRVEPQGGQFALALNGQRQRIIETAHNGDPVYYQAGPFFFEPGYHVLDIISLVETSGTAVIAIDYVDVFNGPPLPPTPEAAPTATPEPIIQVASVELVREPPAPLASPTPLPAAVIVLDVVVAVDANASGTVDLDEGVRDVPIRLVDALSNQLLATAFTDERGFARVQVVSSREVVAFVPLLNASRTIRPRRGGQESHAWELLVDAGNQPGIIP